ncbi:hypothetical protein HN873_011419 [Arachis hypogaea]
MRKSRRRARGSLWKLRLKLRSELSDLVELILMPFQVIRKYKNCNPQLKLLTTSKVNNNYCGFRISICYN